MITIPARQVLARTRKLKLGIAISEAIDKICKDENFEITYAEINSALLDRLSLNNGYELRELWKDKDEEEEENETDRDDDNEHDH